MPRQSAQSEPASSDGRERILREARSLFLDRGFQETSMQDIADAAGMTKAALYYHFRDKTHLVSTMIAIEEERLREGMQEFCSNANDLREALHGVAAYLFRTLSGDLPRLIMDVYKQLPPEEVKELDLQRNVFDDSCVYALLKAAAGEGRTNPAIDPELAAMLWFGMIFTQVRVARMTDGLPDTPDVLAQTITTIFLDGLLTETSPPSL